LVPPYYSQLAVFALFHIKLEMTWRNLRMTVMYVIVEYILFPTAHIALPCYLSLTDKDKIDIDI